MLLFYNNMNAVFLFLPLIFLFESQVRTVSTLMVIVCGCILLPPPQLIFFFSLDYCREYRQTILALFLVLYDFDWCHGLWNWHCNSDAGSGHLATGT
jgi:hypothetical protein